VAIGNDGTVTATLQGESEPSNLGQIEIASFMNPSGLTSIGGNLLTESAASGVPQVGVAGLEGRGLMRSGYLETSNVN
ncbi:flagellar basal body rod protein FlgG, partial [Escherichia coli]